MDPETERRRAILLEEKLSKERPLLANIKQHLAELQKLLEKMNSEWSYEDGMYRFYYQSHKVYRLQSLTLEIVAALIRIAPDGRPFATFFKEVIEQGTKRQFTMEVNERWLTETTPITVAFLHARYFLEMAIKYGPLEQPPQPMPSGYAALLCLYGLR
jgi:hypothetical protein